jgi:hypothetical protein
MILQVRIKSSTLAQQFSAHQYILARLRRILTRRCAFHMVGENTSTEDGMICFPSMIGRWNGFIRAMDGSRKEEDLLKEGMKKAALDYFMLLYL